MVFHDFRTERSDQTQITCCLSLDQMSFIFYSIHLVMKSFAWFWGEIHRFLGKSLGKSSNIVWISLNPWIYQIYLGNLQIFGFDLP